jgi:hypothetical protein
VYKGLKFHLIYEKVEYNNIKITNLFLRLKYTCSCLQVFGSDFVLCLILGSFMDDPILSSSGDLRHRTGIILYIEYIECLSLCRNRVPPQGADPHPPSSKRRKAGGNNLNEETIPLLPTGKDERFSQTISYLGHAALLRRCEHLLYTKELN